MSIEAIEAIEDFLRNRYDGVSMAEIKRRVEEFVKVREEYLKANPRVYTRKQFGYERNNYVIREGRKLKRDKLE